MRASFGLRRCGLASAASHATDSQDAYPNPKYRSITTYIMAAKRASTRMLFVMAGFKTFKGTSAAAPAAAAIATIIRAACFPKVGGSAVHSRWAGLVGTLRLATICGERRVFPAYHSVFVLIRTPPRMARSLSQAVARVPC